MKAALLRTHAPSADWIAEHRVQWARKRSLRAVYGHWFRLMREHCVPGTSVVELGCGPGFFKEMYPEIVATDVVPNPYADRVIDATVLPFGDGEVGNFVMLDVFHHLPRPDQFLREVARTLRPAGRLIMIEPWLGQLGRVIFRYVHHEDCDLTVDPAAPWSAPGKDPMQGNAALPYLYFQRRGHLQRTGLPLRVERCRPFAGLPWLLSGGFQPLNLLPAPLVGVVEQCDRLVSLLPVLTAVRCFIVVEKGG